MSLYKIPQRDIQDRVKECIEISLAYELKRHYNLRYYPYVHIAVCVSTAINMSNRITNLERQFVVETRILEIGYTDAKDHFVMSLRSEKDVLNWLNERATIIGNGIVKQLVRRCDELFEKPEDVIEDITNAMRRI